MLIRLRRGIMASICTMPMLSCSVTALWRGRSCSSLSPHVQTQAGAVQCRTHLIPFTSLCISISSEKGQERNYKNQGCFAVVGSSLWRWMTWRSATPPRLDWQLSWNSLCVLEKDYRYVPRFSSRGSEGSFQSLKRVSMLLQCTDTKMMTLMQYLPKHVDTETPQKKMKHLESNVIIDDRTCDFVFFVLKQIFWVSMQDRGWEKKP